MNKKLVKYLKIIVTLVIIALFVWFIIIWPMYTFKSYEKKTEEAARRYYDLNSTKLPTGNRIATVSLKELYHKAYLSDDFYIPYTKEPCSINDSWVKVRKVKGEYKYYTYLKCGAMQSNIDNKGPEIKLNGSDTINLNVGDTYKELGVKSVVDNSDGKLNPKDVTIKSSSVDTTKIGTYEVSYIALDSLKNKTTVIRKVNVVSKLKNTVNLATDKKGYYTGENPNNYVTLSGMLFRIIGVDGDNVKVIAEEDVANVNYAGIDKWLDYYMEHINDDAKKLLVKNKYCNMNLTEETLDTTECTSTTKNRYAYIVSITDINKSITEQKSFLKPATMSWTANMKDDTTSYTIRNTFFGSAATSKYLSESIINNYGVRPVLTIKGDTVIKSGDGTYEKPYSFGETKTGKTDEKINTRYSGEYLEYAGTLWRIVEIDDDGTTKVISVDNIKNDDGPVLTNYSTSGKTKIYNPQEKGNIGYFINNRVSEYINTSYFVNHDIEVPIYKKDISYGKETSTKKYKVKLSAPNMYEMFSARADNNNSSYWLINSSKAKYYKGVVTDAGVTLYGEIGDLSKFGIRVVGNLNKSVMITKGKGTRTNPYSITK